MTKYSFCLLIFLPDFVISLHRVSLHQPSAIMTKHANNGQNEKFIVDFGTNRPKKSHLICN